MYNANYRPKFHLHLPKIPKGQIWSSLTSVLPCESPRKLSPKTQKQTTSIIETILLISPHSKWQPWVDFLLNNFLIIHWEPSDLRKNCYHEFGLERRLTQTRAEIGVIFCRFLYFRKKRQNLPSIAHLHLEIDWSTFVLMRKT